jgi:hypothetical protein
MMEQKRLQIEETLLSEASSQLIIKMIEQGADPESEEFKAELNPEKLKTLPEIQDFFTKDYRSLIEEWASHQLNVDEERFKMQELEETAFRDMLICDREFWHFRMMEDDYNVELWNPALTFYQKSPDSRYISESNFAGKCDMMTVADVIDIYGYLMNEDQLKTLERIYPAANAKYLLNGQQNDGSYYDSTRSHEWNTKRPGLDYRRLMSNYDYNSSEYGGDIVQEILKEGDDIRFWGDDNMMRVTTCYWKTQRRVGHLTKISESGKLEQEIIDDVYKISDTPIYNTKLHNIKTKENLIQGEHIDWFWINEVWGGVKIGPNSPTSWRNETNEEIPIYLGINQKKPGRLEYQFKGDNSLYGCKLPIEGRVFSDRNTRSTSLVDLMKAYQVGYNMVNNQIADILVDELGTVIMFDQNALPRHSMGEDWGKNNLAKAYVAMKDFGMLPLDTSITNTENATNFNHYQTLNLEQTNRLMSRIQLANHFKQQAFESIGVNQQRMGTPIAQQTATGVTQAMNQSYAQTEMFFTQHSDHLMPRVHQMRTDLSQYYHSTNPSVRLSYITSEAEKVNFQINGTKLLLRDFNVFCTTKTNHRQILEQLKQMALTNNTTGASIFDLGNVIKATSIAEVTTVLKNSEIKQQSMMQQQQQSQQQMAEQQQKSVAEQAQAQRLFETEESEKNRQKDITVAEIRSAGYGAQQDINQNEISDYQDALQDIRLRTEYRETMNLKRQELTTKNVIENSKLGIEQEKLSTQRAVADNNLAIARENRNKYDVKLSKDKPKNKDK